jgi:ferrous iron transport protein A
MLDVLRPGQRATITAVMTRGPQRRRLMDLGLIPGTEVGVELTSPLGDPTAYLVMDTVVVLRRSQAREIQVDSHGGDCDA